MQMFRVLPVLEAIAPDNRLKVHNHLEVTPGRMQTFQVLPVREAIAHGNQLKVHNHHPGTIIPGFAQTPIPAADKV
jgi:hypothetical protein